MNYIEPVVDRTLADVTNKTSKGFYNVADWNRLVNNVAFVKSIVELLTQTSISLISVGTVTTTAFPSVTDLNHLLANINTVKTVSGITLDNLKANWLENNPTENPTYVDANLWEKTLETIRKTVINGLLENRIYSGVGNAGQERLWQVRFRTFDFVNEAADPVEYARSGLATCGASLTRNNKFRRY